MDPATGTVYRFITNEHTLPPGLIALLYKLRWDAEKVFDEVKNKTHEKKAWGDGDVIKIQQSLFISLAHNLMRIVEITLKNDVGITDKISAGKREVRMNKEIQTIKDNGRTPNPLVVQWTRPTQRTFQFIRHLTTCLDINASWRKFVKTLKPLMESYLT